MCKLHSCRTRMLQNLIPTVAYLALLMLSLGVLRGAEAGAAALGQLNELTPFSQCGGVMEISCPATSCRDAPWRGFICRPGYRCGRQNKFYWQCVTAGSAGPDTLPVTPNSATAVQEEESNTADEVVVTGEPVFMRTRSSTDDRQHRKKPAVVTADDLQAAQGKPALEASHRSAGAKEQCGGSADCAFGSSVCGDRQWTACPDAHRCVRLSSLYWQCVQLQMLDNNSSNASTTASSHPRLTQRHQATLQAAGKESLEDAGGQPQSSAAAAPAVKADQAVTTKPDNKASSPAAAASSASINTTQGKAADSAPSDERSAPQGLQAGEDSSSSAPDGVTQPKTETMTAGESAGTLKGNRAADLGAAPDADLVLEFSGLSIDEFKSKYAAGCLASVAQLSGVAPASISVSITDNSKPASPDLAAQTAPAATSPSNTTASAAVPSNATESDDAVEDLDGAAPIAPLFAADGLPMFPNRLRKAAAKARARVAAVPSPAPAALKAGKVTASYGLHIGSITQTISIVSNLTGSTTTAVQEVLAAHGVPLQPTKILVNGHQLKSARATGNNQKLTYSVPIISTLDLETAAVNITGSTRGMLPLERATARVELGRVAPAKQRNTTSAPLEVFPDLQQQLEQSQQQQPEELISQEVEMPVSQPGVEQEISKLTAPAAQELEAPAEYQQSFLGHWGFKLLVVLGSFIFACLLLTTVFCLAAAYVRKKRRVESLDSEAYSEYDEGQAQDYHQTGVYGHQSFGEESTGDASDRGMLGHPHQDGQSLRNCYNCFAQRDLSEEPYDHYRYSHTYQ